MYCLIFSKGSKTEELPTSWLEDSFVDSVATLKKNVSDTLTFLHQERNDFLPEDDIIIPSRKDDHIAKEINLDSINLKTTKHSSNDDSLKVVTEEVDDIIKQAEEIVNENKNCVKGALDKIKKVITPEDEVVILRDKTEENIDTVLDHNRKETSDSIDHLESVNNFVEEARENKEKSLVSLLEGELSSPLVEPAHLVDAFLEQEISYAGRTFSPESSKSPKSPKSGIPVAKSVKKTEKETDDSCDQNKIMEISCNKDENVTKILSVKGGKIKTIKKHSKDPLKEFVILSKDVNWDDDDNAGTEIIRSITTSDPILKTTITTTICESSPEYIKSKIPVLQTETLPSYSTEVYQTSETEMLPKSKIPVLKTEKTKITRPETITVERQIISPDLTTKIVETTTTQVSSSSKNRSTVDSESDEDSRKSPPLKGILKKSGVRTIGSSSGSDIALHEEGAELSDDGSGMFSTESYLFLL